MSTNDSPSLNNNRKLTASFSSPEFNESSLLSSSSVDGVSESSNVTSTLHTINSTVSGNGHSNQTTITTSNSNSMIQKSTSSTNTGIKLNTTRDSGFSDSLIEDSTASTTQVLTRSETLDGTKNLAKLNSVDEDNATVDKDDLSKEFITIVKTTKVTTKVKHIKNPSSNTTTTTTTKQSNGKNKKNKKNKNRIEKIDENRQLAEIVTEIITENESTISANINSNNQIIDGNVQAFRSVTKTTSNNGDATTKHVAQRIEEDDERTSSSSESNNNDIYDEEDEEDSQLAELNGLHKSKKKQQKEDTAVIKVNINKSTEELVFQALPLNKSLTNKLKEQDQKDSLATTTYSTTQHLSTTLSSDLNTSMLDSEELLSDYSTSHQVAQLDTTSATKPTDLNASLSSSIKEIPNVIDFVLNDVTNNNNNNKTEEETNKTETLTQTPPTTTTTTKTDKKKKRKFNIFSKASRDSKRKLNKKDDLLVESPSKQARKEDTVDIKNLIGLTHQHDTIKYHLLDEEQKDRVNYLKTESIDLLMNYFVQFESNSNTKTQLTNLRNQACLDELIRKMLARSLDLLRHDKVESFEKLAAQLKQEYQVTDSSADEIVDENFDFNALNSATNDLVFGKLIREALVDKKLLLNLNFDKSSKQPCEEMIEFGASTQMTSTPIVRPPVVRPAEKLEEKEEVIQMEPIKQVEETAKPVEEEIKPIVIEQVKVEEPEGARILLDTVKEPPIVFTSDIEPKSVEAQVSVVAQPKVETTPAESEKLVKKPSTKKRSKKQKNKKNALSCLACGSNSIKKSEEDLNKLEEKQQEQAKLVEEVKLEVREEKPVEQDLTQRHRDAFSNLDSKPTGDELTENERHVEPVVEEQTTSDLPQNLNIEVEVNVKKEEGEEEEEKLASPVVEQLEVEVVPTPPSTPEELNQSELIVQARPAVELARLAEVKLTEKPIKKTKKAKKDKTKVTNEIQLTSSGLVDVSVLDVKIETFVEPEVKAMNVDSLPVQTISEAQTEPARVDVNEELPGKINLQSIQMENELAEVERKSFSQLITQTVEENNLNTLPVCGSNLDIKTEIDIGIEKEIVKEEEQIEVKCVKSDDIVKLPEPQVVVQQQPLIEVTSVVIDTPPKEAKAKKEKKTKASCFSCRARKVKKEKDEAKQPIIESDTSAKNTTPPLATAEEESKQVQVEIVQTEEETKPTNLFVGLDRRASEKPLDVPSIYTIELNEKATVTKQDVAETISKEESEKKISPSMIGSTSLESNQEMNNVANAEIEIESTKAPVDESIAAEVVETIIKSVETKEDEAKVLSNDIVVLPEPPVVEVKIETVVSEEPKKEEKLEEKKSEKAKKKKKKSPTSCFPKSKGKKEKSDVVDETKPAEAPAKPPVQLKLDEPDLTAPTVSAVAAEHRTVENWAVGLDRKDDDVVVRRDPVEYVAEPVKVEETLQEVKTEAKVESIDEIKQEPLEKVIETKQEIEIKQNLTEGSWVVIDRAPDHAIIPDMTQLNVVAALVTSDKPANTGEATKQESSELKSEKTGRKTTRIDMPLISLCAPVKSAKKKREKKKKSSKSDSIQTAPETTAAKPPIAGVLEMPEIDEKSKPKEKEEEEDLKEAKPIEEVAKQEEEEAVETTESQQIVEVETKEEIVKEQEEKVEIEQVSRSVEETQIQVISETITVSEVKQEEEEEVVKPPEEEASKPVEEITVEETKLEVQEEITPVVEIANKSEVEQPVVHIKLDREPDVVKLPEPGETRVELVALNEVKLETAKEEEEVKKEETTKQTEDKHKRTTSILDMPLINILVPKDKSKKAEKKQKKKSAKKAETAKSEVAAAAAAAVVEKPKEQIPELLIIDVPTLDIVKPNESEPVREEEEANFDAKIPVVAETSVDNFIIKIEEETKPEIEVKKEEDEKVPFEDVELEKKADQGVDDGSWVIIDRQPDHAVIPIVQPSLDVIVKPAEEQVLATPSASEPKPTESKKKSKSNKKPISCFSCKARSAKKEKEIVKSTEPVELKQDVPAPGVATPPKPVELAEKTEIKYDFSGLDRRDSQEPIRSEPPEATLETEASDAPKEELKSENIEEIIKEELKEVDKQYSEFTKLVESSETNVETFETISEQVVSIVNQTETVTSEIVTEKYELEVETRVVENEDINEATKRLDDVLEKAEIEIKKLDETFDLKVKEEAQPVEEKAAEFKGVKSDDIVKLPEPQVVVVQQPLIEVTSVVIDTPPKEVKAKKEKKTKASCFSCRARKAKETQEKLGENVPQTSVETKKEEAIAVNEPAAAPVSPKSEINYDPNVFKGLDRLDDSQLVKQPVDLDEIKAEPVLTTPKQEDVFNQVIQEIIVETSKLTEEAKQEEIVAVESPVEVVVHVEEEEKPKVVENLVSLEIPSGQPQASSSPKKLSDDIVVLPEPVVHAQVAQQQQVDLPPQQEQEQKPDETKSIATPKKSFISLICGKKAKTSEKKEKTKKKKSEKQSPPPQIVVEPPLKLDDLETKEPISLGVLDTPAPEETPVLPGQPPKKPPRGHLDASVVEHDLESLIPKTDDLAIETTQLTPALLDPQVTQPLKIEIQSIVTSKESLPEPKSPVLNAITEQQVLTTNVTTSLLSTTTSESSSKSVTHVTSTSSSTVLTKVIEYPSVVDIDPSLISPSKRVTTWTTDPLPHVQIGLHKINENEKEQQQLVEVKQEQADSKVETKPEEQPKVEAVQTTETVKLLEKDELKLLKSKQTQAVEYLKQKAGYTLTSSSTKHERETEKIAGKLFKKGIKTLIKNDAKQAVTYAKLNKKLSKEVSAKKYSSEITHCSTILKQEHESGNLLTYLKSENTRETQQHREENANEKQITTTSDSNSQEIQKEKSESSDKLEADQQQQQPAVMKRCPSLTWREANERARILFYKGRVPSIHYNEKRDSFRVSMITSVSTNGTEKTTEVPVCDDDVRRLLNSCGLYWNGESISLLNKSDDIFSIAQQEAFDILQLINSNNN